jgi:hypothetical protein
LFWHPTVNRAEVARISDAGSVRGYAPRHRTI